MSGRAGLLLAVSAAAALAAPARAVEPAPPCTLHAGAIEAGLALSVVAVEGTTQARTEASIGTFVAAPRGLLGLELDGGWTHVRADDVFDALGAVTWGGRLGQSVAHPFAGAVLGVRHERLGSFRETRYPVGGVLGVRVLASERAALRAEWRLLKVLDDPVENPLEQQVLAGVSVFFRNVP
ncbi:MAG: hypothetical protein U0167_09220 [bacterium]